MPEKKSALPVVKVYATHSVGSHNLVFRNEVFDAVRGGACREETHTLIPDCTGDNISEKNQSYCELTTQYWVWKNVEADYYGFIHYRRFLSFADKTFGSGDWSVVQRDYLNDRALKEIGVTDEEQVRSVVGQFDVLAPEPVHLERVHLKSVYEQYRTGVKLHPEDLDLMAQIVKDVAPEYDEACRSYLNGKLFYPCNMFIMKKELFHQYCQFLFAVLSEFDKRRDLSLYSAEGYRTPGHLGERLFGVFYTYLKNKGTYRLGTRELIYFKYTQEAAALSPAFGGEGIPVVLSADQDTLPFASATLASLAANAAPDRKYDVILITRQAEPHLLNRLASQVKGKENFSLRFLDCGSFFDEQGVLEKPSFSDRDYIRPALPYLLPAYDKILYLNADVIALADVAALYDTDLGDDLLAGVRDIAVLGALYGGDADLAAYYRALPCAAEDGIIDPGVLLMNTRLLRERFPAKELLDAVETRDYRFRDKDPLNVLCAGKILYLEDCWNYSAFPAGSPSFTLSSFSPREAFTRYQSDKNRIRLLHFADSEKPWQDPDREYAEIFWIYFRETPFYEAFLMGRMAACADSAAQSCRAAESAPASGGKFSRLLPKGSRRRAFVKKIVCLFRR